jgi:hypothetical protein
MTITISLPPGTEEKLLKRAAESGVAADALARALLEAVDRVRRARNVNARLSARPFFISRSGAPAAG